MLIMWIKITLSVEGKMVEIAERVEAENGPLLEPNTLWINLDAMHAIKLTKTRAQFFASGLPVPVITRVPEEMEMVRQYLESK